MAFLRTPAHLVILRTWTLSGEPTMEPPRLLKEECAKAGLAEGAFTVCALGETTVV